MHHVFCSLPKKKVLMHYYCGLRATGNKSGELWDLAENRAKSPFSPVNYFYYRAKIKFMTCAGARLIFLGIK